MQTALEKKKFPFVIDKRAWRYSFLPFAVIFCGLLFNQPFVLLLGNLLLIGHLMFFRDPQRATPQEEGLLISPADGQIADVTEVQEDRYLNEPAVRIGIFLSVFDAHVTRAPMDGEIASIEYVPGKFLNAMKKKCSQVNESNWIGIADGARRVLIRQISGAIARRIYCDVREKQRLERGGKIGIICYGSRVEFFVAKSAFDIAVQPGQRVKSGFTILGRWKS